MRIQDRLTIAPITSRILRQLLGYRELETSAIETQTICPSEIQKSRPAIALENQLEQITDVHEFSAGLSDEITKATTETQEHIETQAFKLKHVFLTHGNLCSYQDYKKLTYSKTSFKPTRIHHEYKTAAMCSSAGGNDYFAHFVFDDACTAKLGEQFGQVVFANLGTHRTEHMLSYLSYMNIDYEDLTNAYFEELWLFRDISLNRNRRGRLQAMRDSLSLLRNDHTTANVYIKRGSSGTKRNLLNEDKITKALEQCGFQIIDPETLTLAEIIKRINGANVAVGVEGSHLLHGLLNLKVEGTLLCIQPPDRFNAIYRPFTNALDLNWAFVVGEGNTDGFTLSLDSLMATLDRCDMQ